MTGFSKSGIFITRAIPLQVTFKIVTYHPSTGKGLNFLRIIRGLT
jgi:hypothetical protein